MLTTQQAADRLGVSRRRLLSLIKTGRLIAQRFGNAWMIAQADIDTFHRKPQGWPKGTPRR